MDWLKVLIKEYLDDRKKLLEKEWFTFKKLLRRLYGKTRHEEMSRLVVIDTQLNERWCKKISEIIESNNINTESLEKAILAIETNIKKQNNRSVFLVIFGAVIAGAFKIIGLNLSFILVTFVFILAGERLIVNETVAALEELKLIIEQNK